MKANVALRASACVLNRQRASNSHSSVAKKLSHMALSYASPTEPIEGRTPASRQRWPNSIELYWLDSNGRPSAGKEITMASLHTRLLYRHRLDHLLHGGRGAAVKLF